MWIGAAVLAVALLITLALPRKRLWEILVGGLVELLLLATILLFAPAADIDIGIGIGIIIGVGIIVANVLRYRGQQEVHKKLDGLHSSLRSELKVRAKDIVSLLIPKIVLAKIAETTWDDDMFKFERNRAKTYKDLVFTFNANQGKICRALSDFETCNITVPPEIKTIMESFVEQRMDGIEALVKYLTDSAKKL